MNTKKWLALLCLLLVLPFVPVTQVEAAENDGAEVVILFDVSGSMEDSDPQNSAGTRMSIEAAYQLAFNYPTESNFFITLIPYNSDVCTGLQEANVATTSGMNLYKDNLEKILYDNIYNDQVLLDITCWKRQTDIGGAMKAAADHLLRSTRNTKKAVILFTDGRIQMLTEAEARESKLLAEESKEVLEENDITIFSVGLNSDGSVDRAFLESLSGSDNTKIVHQASELSGIFTELYTKLFENSYTEPGPGESFPVRPDVPSSQTIKIYEQAVKEVNVSLASMAKLHTIKVVTPSGVTVVDIDLRNNTENVNGQYCVVNHSGTGCTATIKITNPMGGDWTVSVTGEESTVITRKVFLYDLKVKDSIASDTAFVGESLCYSATIYNAESNIHLTATGLYSEEDGASAVTQVENVETGRVSLYNGALNAGRNGYNFEIPFSSVGTYRITTILHHSQFEVKSVKEVAVVGPSICISTSAPDVTTGKTDITVSLKNPNTGEMITSVPTDIQGQSIEIQVVYEEEFVDSHSFLLKDMTSGEYVYSYTLERPGIYAFCATGSLYGQQVDSEMVQTTLSPSEISVSNAWRGEIVQSALSAEFSETIDLKQLFEDSDGDHLTFSVSIKGESPVKATLNGTKLVITSEECADATIVVFATDGKGAECSREIKVSFTSAMPILITCIIVGLVVIAGSVILIVVIKKKSIISVSFKFCLELEDENSYTSTRAVYSVGRLSSKKSARPKMTLREIFEKSGYAQMEAESTMSEEDAERCIEEHGDSLLLSGVPFKKAVKINYKPSADKGGKGRNYTLASNNVVTLRLGESGYTVSFANSRYEF